jgi:hypothetical protein
MHGQYIGAEVASWRRVRVACPFSSCRLELRKRRSFLKFILRAVIARTVDDPADVEADIRALFAALARSARADSCDLRRDFPF